MGSYYYLGAQLPYLVYGQHAPMSSSEFKTIAKKVMRSAEAKVLNFCTLEPGPDKRCPSAFINRWKLWERNLRLNLAKSRAAKLKREGVPNAPEYIADAVTASKNALAMESPLEAELYLDKLRWDAIEQFQGYSAFSQNAIYAYLLKLLLMERRASFKTEEGFSEYKGLYAAILGEAK